MPANPCVCGNVFDWTTPLPTTGTATDAQPKPLSSLTICMKCGRCCRFDADLKIGEAVDLDALPMDPKQKRELRRIQSVIAARRPS